MTDWKEKIEAQIAWLAMEPEPRTQDCAQVMRDLLDVAVAAEDDRVCAEANCGKTGGDRDCSAYVSRGLRCSDCPVEVWLESTVEALDKLREVSDE